MGFTLALSCVLVTAGNCSHWGTDGSQVTAVTGNAAIWIWGFKIIPTRETVCTLTTCYCSLTLTLTSYLEVRNRRRKKMTFKGEMLKGFTGHQQLAVVCVLVYTWAHSRLPFTVPAVWQLQGWHTSTEVGSESSSLKNPLRHSSQFLPESETQRHGETETKNVDR